jgi:O-antigen/teichoic acid export membrane protein
MFVTNIMAARLLSQEVFGQFMMLRSTISIFESIVSGSLGSPIIKRVAESSHQKENLNSVINAIFFINITIILLLSILLLIFTPWIVETYFLGKVNLVNAFYIAILLLAGTILSSLIQGILIGLEEYKRIAFSGILTSIISLPLIIYFIYNFNFYGAIFGVACYFIIDFLIKYIQFKKVYISEILKQNKKQLLIEIKNLLNSSKYLLYSTIIISLTFWYARVFIINKTDSFENIAIFDAAFQWLSIIMIITGATTSVALPMMSKVIGMKSQDEKKVFNINLFVNLFISIFIMIIFIIFSENIMSLYGENYIQGSSTLIILAISSIFFTLYSIYNKWMVSHKQTKSILLSNIIAAIVLFGVLNFSSFEGTVILALSFGSFYFTNFLVLVISKKNIG